MIGGKVFRMGQNLNFKFSRINKFEKFKKNGQTFTVCRRYPDFESSWTNLKTGLLNILEVCITSLPFAEPFIYVLPFICF